MLRRLTLILLCAGFTLPLAAQQDALILNLSVAESLREAVLPEGRLLLRLRDEGGKRYTFGRRADNLKTGNLSLWANADWTSSSALPLPDLPAGTYTARIEYDQKQYPVDPAFPNRLRSVERTFTWPADRQLSFNLDDRVDEPVLTETELVREFRTRSAALSAHFGQEVELKVGILLPPNYADEPNRRYPVRYNIAGYGGRWTRVQRLLKDQDFLDWYRSGEAPDVISVYLDSDGPYGDNYQLNSKNSGPFGDALIQDLIPAIEREYRVLPGADNRFTDGCSTGGWVSLALQLLYPDEFGAVYSYSPDPVSFTWMQLINLYEDENAFYNRDGYLTPTHRTVDGRPTLSIKQEVADENAVGENGTYTTSRGQWGAWNALYGPRGEDGYPSPVFDPQSGVIDKSVVDQWKPYDLLLHTKANWPTLGPKIAGKVYVWMGDMDNYYLNNALRDMDAFLKQTTDPVSDAEIEFTPMEGHCSLYSTRRVLTQIGERLESRR